MRVFIINSDSVDTPSISNMMSLVLSGSAESVNTKDTTQTAIVQDLLLNSYTVHALATARIYHTQVNSKPCQWDYSRLRGTLVFGQDKGGVSSTTGLETGGIETLWFRLLDEISGKTVWVFKFPSGFKYQVDRPFFHLFLGRVDKLEFS